MSVLIHIDVETICTQKPGAREEFIELAKTNCRPPPKSTKASLGAELGMSDKDIKFTSAGDLSQAWVDRFADEKAESNGDEAWRRTALDGATGELLSVAWAVDDADVQCIYRMPGDDEGVMLREVFATICADLGPTGGKRMPMVCAHNAPFDIGFLYRRAVILGVKPSFKLKPDGRHGSDFFCTSQAWCGFGKRISQDALCTLLGLPLKPDGIDGSKVYDAWVEGRHSEIQAYNKYDTGTVREIYKRLTFS